MAFTSIELVSLAVAVAAGNVVSKIALDNQKEILGFLSAVTLSIPQAVSMAFSAEPAFCFAFICAAAPVALSFVVVSVVNPKNNFLPILITPPGLVGMSFGSALCKHYKEAGMLLCGTALLTAIPVMAYYGVNSGSPALVGIAATMAVMHAFLSFSYSL